MSKEFDGAILRYRAEALAARRPGALSDRELEKVAGGVGGADEATCPKCGKPMRMTGKDFGDGFWSCGECGATQLLSDAETIEIIRYMEMIGYPEIEYPIWWSQVKK